MGHMQFHGLGIKKTYVQNERTANSPCARSDCPSSQDVRPHDTCCLAGLVDACSIGRFRGGRATGTRPAAALVAVAAIATRGGALIGADVVATRGVQGSSLWYRGHLRLRRDHRARVNPRRVARWERQVHRQSRHGLPSTSRDAQTCHGLAGM